MFLKLELKWFQNTVFYVNMWEGFRISTVTGPRGQ